MWTSGRVLVDGVDVREMSQEHLRAKIGFVPQKAVLFSGTVAENIRYGNEDASEEEVKHAADIAQATEFIAEMRDGFDSVIAQGGTNVSGGQKQRLSIARALVRKPEIYVFDDTFSALDYTTDAKLRAALRRETTDATVLIVAQRVGTVMDADQIIVLDEGRIAGIGTHRELMETSESIVKLCPRSCHWRKSHEYRAQREETRRARRHGVDGQRRHGHAGGESQGLSRNAL